MIATIAQVTEQHLILVRRILTGHALFTVSALPLVTSHEAD